MKGRGHVAGTVLGLVGLVGTSTLAGVTSLHVDLEHGHSHELETPEHGHSHTATDARHGHGRHVLDHGHAHQAEAPEHDHPLALVANVERKARQAPIVPLEVAPVDSAVAAPLADRSRPSRPCCTGPPARAAPRALRSVVLQV